MKYIIVKTENGNKAVVFDECLSHKDVARIHSVSQDNIVVSAGFCILNPVKVWGVSDSLKMVAKIEDEDIIKEMLR